jgi:hypothetical protein
MKRARLVTRSRSTGKFGEVFARELRAFGDARIPEAGFDERSRLLFTDTKHPADFRVAHAFLAHRHCLGSPRDGVDGLQGFSEEGLWP